MSWSTRRVILVAMVVVTVATFTVHQIFAQKFQIKPGVPPFPGNVPGPGKPPKPGSSGELTSSLRLPVDEDLKDPLEAARNHILAGNWSEAISWLQKLLKYDHNVFAPVVRVQPSGERSRALVNVRVEASNLIASLPPKGLDFYRLTFGPQAATMLQTAKGSGDNELLSEIMRDFLYTEAGIEATELLATYHLDRGEYTSAALCFERLYRRQKPEKLSSSTLVKASLAFRRAGDKERLELTFKELANKGDEVRLGSRTVAVDDLRKWVTNLKRSFAEYQKSDRPWYGGNLARSGQGRGGTAYLMDANWETPMTKKQPVLSILKNVENSLRGKKQPVLPAYFPIAATVTRERGGQVKRQPVIVYRTYGGMEARTPQGEIHWRTPHADWSMEKMSSKPEYASHFNSWVSSYTGSSLAHRIIETSLVGSLSTDNNRVYCIEDFYVPPYLTNQQFQQQQQLSRFPVDIRQAINYNRLQAFDLYNGKLVWELGGNNTDEDVPRKASLKDAFFLGPPLPMGGKLYVMMEKKDDLYLVTLSPEDGRVLDRLRLAITDEKMGLNIHRRANAVHLAYGDGIMVCPTHAGGILGVDLMTKDLIWMYEYREAGGKPAPGGGGGIGFPGGGIVPPGGVKATTAVEGWKSSAPVISNGKVVFAAPDANAIHCVNLRDGSRAWAHSPQRGEDDLYLAGVFAQKVIIVGKKSCRALNLNDGSIAWDLETGEPSGRGVASDDIYYLPLRAGKTSRLPEICAIDIKAGLIKGRTIARPKKPGVGGTGEPEVPGNLLFYEGQVISQSLSKVSSYPQLAVQIKKIDTELAKNPNNPLVRYERGTLRLYKGDLSGAVEDLQESLESKKLGTKEAECRARLYDTFTEFFQRDFDKAEKHLDSYKMMCKVVTKDLTGEELLEAKKQEKIRMGNYYCLLGKGREEQKKYVEAYQAYMNFARLGQESKELMSVVDEPYVKASASVWAQGRIAAMALAADEGERKPLEDLIRKQFLKVKAERDIEGLKSFVTLFGSLRGVGREARMELARQLIRREDTDSLAEAQRHLGILRGQQDDLVLAGQAVEMLASLMIRHEMMEDAAFYYELLGRRFAEVKVRDGRTGRELYNESLSDKRLIAYMDDPQPIIQSSAVSVQVKKGVNSYRSRYYQFEPQGDDLPFFRRYTLAIRTDGFNQFKVIDRFSGGDYWTLNLPRNSFNRLAAPSPRRRTYPQIEPRYPFYNMGHLVILQVGYMVYGLDPVNKKKLWEKNLAGTATPQYSTHNVDPKDGTVTVYYRDGWVQRLGGNKALSAKAVCLQTHNALIAVHPVSGKTLWSRSDVAKLCHLYNDNQHLFVIEINNAGTPGRARVFRVDDGVELRKVKDFSSYYARRVKMFGRSLLFTDINPKGQKTLRLYDVLKGQNIWTKTLSANAKVLESEVKHLTGVVETNGKVTLIDLKKGQQTVTSQMKPEHIKDVETVRLLQDRHYFYVVCDKTGTAPGVTITNRMTNLMPNTGMRWVSTNGYVYSFHNKTGKRNWYYRPKDYENKKFPGIPQMMVLESFEEMPAVVFTTRYYQRNGFNNTYVVTTEIVNKKTGKLMFDEKLPSSGTQQFHTIRVDPRANRVDMISYDRQLSMMIDKEKAKK